MNDRFFRAVQIRGYKVMEIHVEKSVWKRLGEKFKMVREDLKKDSVASNPRKPVDCCNPPVPPVTENKIKNSGK